MAAKWISFKEGIYTPNLNPVLTKMLDAAQAAAPNNLHFDMIVVTSFYDGIHSPSSRHFAAEGVDIRTHPNPDGSLRPGCIDAPDSSALDTEAALWVKRIRATLGYDFECIYEAEKRHIHLAHDAFEFN